MYNCQTVLRNLFIASKAFSVAVYVMKTSNND